MNPHVRSDLRFSLNLIFSFTELFYNKSLINRKNARHSGSDRLGWYLPCPQANTTAYSGENPITASLSSVVTPRRASSASSRSPPAKQELFPA